MKFSFLLVFVLCASLVSSISVCVDNAAPSAPTNLEVTSSDRNIILTWGEAVDTPSCSGIDYYNISRDGEWIGSVNGDILTYTDLSVPYGTYSYSVFGVDLVGHNSGPAIKNDVVLSDPGNGGNTNVGGGSSSSSYICVENWSCEEWSDCIGNDMRRICNDLNECGTENNKPETYQECGVSKDDGATLESEIEENDVSQPDGFFSSITGAVIGGGATSVAVGGVFLILVLGGFVIAIRKKKK